MLIALDIHTLKPTIVLLFFSGRSRASYIVPAVTFITYILGFSVLFKILHTV